LIKRYKITERQTLLGHRLPFQDEQLYFKAMDYR